MKVIGVVDLLDGQAVHARAGRRSEYGSVAMVAGVAIPPGDPLALGRVYLERLGISELYVADLDGILGEPPQLEVVRRLASLAAPLWLDAGVTSIDRAREARDLGARHVVIGLETLISFAALEAICTAIGSDHVSFSLDLRDGRPVVAAEATGIEATAGAADLAARAARAGVGSIIVLDLIRVGGEAGVDVEMLGRIRTAAPNVAIYAAGGVRDVGDLSRLAEAGYDGALVATALHKGQISAPDIAAIKSQGSVNR